MCHMLLIISLSTILYLTQMLFFLWFISPSLLSLLTLSLPCHCAHCCHLFYFSISFHSIIGTFLIIIDLDVSITISTPLVISLPILDFTCILGFAAFALPV